MPISDLVKRFWGDERGSLTVEFMLWLPLLMMWFVVSVVFYDAYRTRHLTATSTLTIADLASRRSTISDADMDAFYVLLQSLLGDLDGTVMLRITSIEFEEGDEGTGVIKPLEDDADDRHCIDWSVIRGQDPDAVDPEAPDFLPITQEMLENSDLPDRLPTMVDEDHVMFVQVRVPFIPFSDWMGIEARTWDYNAIMYPRVEGSRVDYAGLPAVDCLPS